MKARFVTLGLAAASFASAQSQVDVAKAQGLGSFLWICFLGGLLALLTPCVFPMVPVTVSYFSKRTDTNATKAAVVYCLGIIGCFTVVGVATALVFGATGITSFAANPWVNLVLAILFVAMALNLFGLYEIQLPSSLVNKMNAKGRSGGLFGPLIMGTTFALTTFTCTAPIVGSLLAASARGDIWYPALGMTSFGVAFALPFLALALFPSYLNKMPKSGGWLGAVKPALGFIELMAAVKFLSNAELVWGIGLLTRPVFILIWAVLALALAAYLLGFPKSSVRIGLARRGLGIASVALAFFLLTGMKGRGLGEIDAFFPPDPYPYRNAVAQKPTDKKPGVDEEIAWGKNFEAGLKLAADEDKVVFIDFTGVTCVNCRWMEKNVFVKPEVKERLGSMVTVQLYTDRGTDEDNANQELQKKLTKTIALPVYALVKPDGTVIKTFEGASRNSQEFVDFLDQAKS